MSDDPQSEGGVSRYRHLPLLSLLLAFLSLGLIVRLILVRTPSSELEKKATAFSTALKTIPRHYAGETAQDELYEAAMRGMVQSLNDPFSAYLSDFQVRNSEVITEGEFGGIGIIVTPQNGGGVVMETQPESPAEKANIQVGDAIIGVNGQSTSEMSFEEMIARIRGKVGTELTLNIRRVEKGKEEVVSLKREKIRVDSVKSRMLEKGIGYIELKQFDEHCVEDVKKALRDFKKAEKWGAILIDLRGNSGGLLSAAVDICDLFLSSGVIASLDSRVSDETKTFKASSETMVTDEIPIAILVNNRSASASEVMGGALQDHGRATLIGAKTFGKGAVNRIFVLPDGSGMMLTVAHYTAGKNRTIGDGIEPDIVVGEIAPPSQEQSLEAAKKWREKLERARKDQWDRAIQFLSSKIEK
ncbi:MAG: S41 family peptidase [Candidatus Brocadiia bacterium]